MSEDNLLELCLSTSLAREGWRTQVPYGRSLHREDSAARGGRGSVSLLLALTACATGTFAGGVYRDSHTAYRVGPLDASWVRDNPTDCNIAFRNPKGGTIMANALCEGIRDMPLDVLTNQALFGLEHKQEHSRETFTLDGRDAQRTRLSATLDGVPVELDLVVLKKDGCTYDFQLVAGSQVFADREGDFWRFVQGFQQLPMGK